MSNKTTQTAQTAQTAETGEPSQQAQQPAQQQAQAHQTDNRRMFQAELPATGKVLIVQSDGKAIPSDQKEVETRLNSRFFQPAWRYGMTTLLALVGVGAGYAGGVYVTNRKHAKAAADMDSMPVGTDSTHTA